MIDHISIAVSDLEAGSRFYETALAAFGFAKLVVRETTVGFGKKYPEFWLNHRPDMAALPSDSGAHVCLRAPSTEAVDEFYANALKLGGTSDGAPGFRPGDHAGYYAAFVRDPD